jgi:pimeloyl-ACP methyl ester carboxylesterase
VLATYGEFDPIAPPRFANEITEQFPDATIVVNPGAGHGVQAADPCILDITVAFFADPEVPLDIECSTSLPGPSFR